MKKLSDIAEDIVAYNLEGIEDTKEFAITREGFTLYTNQLLELGTKAANAAHKQGLKQGICIGVGLYVCGYLCTKVVKNKQTIDKVYDKIED